MWAGSMMLYLPHVQTRTIAVNSAVCMVIVSTVSTSSLESNSREGEEVGASRGRGHHHPPHPPEEEEEAAAAASRRRLRRRRRGRGRRRRRNDDDDGDGEDEEDDDGGDGGSPAAGAISAVGKQAAPGRRYAHV